MGGGCNKKNQNKQKVKKNKNKHSHNNNSNKKRKWQQEQQNSHNKRHKKQGRFWIEDCKETKLSSGQTPNLDVLITRVELQDDYRQISKPVSTEKDNEKDLVTADGAGTTAEMPPTSTTNDVLEHDEENPPSNKSENTEKSSTLKKQAAQESGDQDASKPSETEAIIFPEKQSSGDDDDQKDDEHDKAESPKKKNDYILVCVRKSASVKKPYAKVMDFVENFEPLPNGDCGDGVINPFPKEEVADKFWSQRRRLFSRYDDGIQLDKESWYSVTPEAIATHIATHLVTSSNREGLTVLDPFCGCGGNLIAFALRKEVALVVGVDTDRERLKRTANNARIYGIPSSKILLIHGNAADVLARFQSGQKVELKEESDDKVNANQAKDTGNDDNDEEKIEYPTGGVELLPDKVDMVFLSPPWGGMNYLKVGKRSYDLSCISIDGKEEGSTLNGEHVLDLAAKATGNGPVAIFLPRNLNGVPIGVSAFKAGYRCPLILEQSVLNGKLKAVTAYLGLGA